MAGEVPKTLNHAWNISDDFEEKKENTEIKEEDLIGKINDLFEEVKKSLEKMDRSRIETLSNKFKELLPQNREINNEEALQLIHFIEEGLAVLGNPEKAAGFLEKRKDYLNEVKIGENPITEIMRELEEEQPRDGDIEDQKGEPQQGPEAARQEQDPVEQPSPANGSTFCEDCWKVTRCMLPLYLALFIYWLLSRSTHSSHPPHPNIIRGPEESPCKIS